MLTVLIPKVVTPYRLSYFRSIFLVGCMHKVLAKILAKLLQVVIGIVISNTQSVFEKRGKFWMVF